jgi:hypothetical protein
MKHIQKIKVEHQNEDFMMCIHFGYYLLFDSLRDKSYETVIVGKRREHVKNKIKTTSTSTHKGQHYSMFKVKLK